jgi:Tol biopolymer transport system component
MVVAEVQLTFNKEPHVDGPNYSYDGKYIYYNADGETGTMQVWRVKITWQQQKTDHV